MSESDEVHALVMQAQNEVANAHTEMHGLRGQLGDCESDLEFLSAAVDNLLEAVDEVVLFVDENLVVEGVSEALVELAGASEEELVGHRVHEVAHRLGWTDLESVMRRVIGKTARPATVNVDGWDVEVRPLDDGGPGAVVIGRRVRFAPLD